MHTSNITPDKSEWIKGFARFGLVSKGIVYTLSGVLALMAALHVGNSDEQNADRTGVFNFVYDQPMGRVLLGIIAIGLLCYACWRLFQGIKDTEKKGTDLKGIGSRAAYVFSGLVYFSIAFYAARIVLTNVKQNGDSKKELAQTLLEQPFGQFLMGIAAAIMIGSGVSQLYRALSGSYKKHVQKHNNTKTASILVKAGQLGYVARGIVWLLVGWFFVKAAYSASPNKAGDSGDSFSWIESAQYGSLLLAVLALGLVCYGVFMFMRARYQHINTD